MTWGLRPHHPGVAQAGSRRLPGSESESECPDWARLGKVLVRSEREDGEALATKALRTEVALDRDFRLCDPREGWEASASLSLPRVCKAGGSASWD